MSCSDFINLSGCGCCYIGIKDTLNISRLTNSSFNVLLNNMLLLFHHNSNKKLLAESTKVRCDGIIFPIYDTSNSKFHCNYNRQICTDILLIWHRAHNHEIANSIDVLYLTTALSSLMGKRSESQSSRNIDDFTTISNIAEEISFKDEL